MCVGLLFWRCRFRNRRICNDWFYTCFGLGGIGFGLIGLLLTSLRLRVTGGLRLRSGVLRSLLFGLVALLVRAAAAIATPATLTQFAIRIQQIIKGFGKGGLAVAVLALIAASSPAIVTALSAVSRFAIGIQQFIEAAGIEGLALFAATATVALTALATPPASTTSTLVGVVIVVLVIIRI